MKNHALVLLFVLSAAALPAAGPGDMAPEINFVQGWNEAEGKARLSQYAGRITLVETWATW